MTASYIGTKGITLVPTGCTVQSSVRITCNSYPYYDRDHVWTVVVRSQTSNNFGPATSYKAPDITAVSSTPTLIPTGTATQFVISGTQFGPVAGNPITATYGPYSAASCSVTTAHLAITCTTVTSGVGTGHRLTVFTSDQQSALSPVTVYLDYAKPSITGLTSLPSTAIPTAGSRQVTINGLNFGPGTPLPDVQYGPYTAIGCIMSTPHFQLKCTTVPGSGANLIWRVSVGGQTSVENSFTTSHITPVITNVSPAVLTTTGGDSIVLTGTNFGPLGTPVSLLYQFGEFCWLLLFLNSAEFYLFVLLGVNVISYSAACSVTSADTEITCTSVAGNGNNLRFQVTVDTISSSFLSTSVRYTIPVITGVSTPGTTLTTTGGETIVFNGNSFGPPTTPTSVLAANLGPTGTELSMPTPACTIISDTRMECSSPVGVGANHKVRVTVAGQISVVNPALTWSGHRRSRAPAYLPRLRPLARNDPLAHRSTRRRSRGARPDAWRPRTDRPSHGD